MICPSFNIHGLKSQVPNQASRSTKVIEPRTYFKLVNRLRFWGFYTKPCCVFSDLRMAKCRRSQPGVFEAFKSKALFCWIPVISKHIIYTLYTWIHKQIYIYIYYTCILYTYHNISCCLQQALQERLRNCFGSPSWLTSRNHPENAGSMHGNARRFCECFSLGFWVVHLLMSAQKGPGHACHVFHVFLDPSARHVSRHSYDLR